MKPAIKEHFIYSTRAKAWRANDGRELHELCQKASQIISIDEVMVQELIPGGGQNQVSYCAFFRQGDPLGKMVVCRVRQHPLEFGRASTYVETIDLPILEELSERFLRAIGYYGLVEVEYKLDRSSGLFKLLEHQCEDVGLSRFGGARWRRFQLYTALRSAWTSGNAEHRSPRRPLDAPDDGFPDGSHGLLERRDQARQLLDFSKGFECGGSF